MVTVFIPSMLRDLTGGEDRVEAEGGTVRQVIESLERQFPGVKERLVDPDQDRLNLRVAVAIDGQVNRLGLLARVEPNSEVTFVAAMSGG